MSNINIIDIKLTNIDKSKAKKRIKKLKTYNHENNTRNKD